MYGGRWAGERPHAVSALYSAKLEFDTVSRDRGAMRFACCALGAAST
jgi:hypothetical protein